MSYLDHFNQAHNADVSGWTPWFQHDALLGYVQDSFKLRGIEFGLWRESDQGLIIPNEPEVALNQLFARFAKETYEDGLLWSWVGELGGLRTNKPSPAGELMSILNALFTVSTVAGILPA